jgi:hypothetical protein
LADNQPQLDALLMLFEVLKKMEGLKKKYFMAKLSHQRLPLREGGA